MSLQKRLLVLALLLSANVTGCKSTKQLADERPPSTAIAPASDTTTVLVVPPRTLTDKILNRPAEAPYRAPAAAVVKIGKKSSVYYGNATIIGKKAVAATADGATATVIEKKAGPAIVNSDSATQQVAANAVAGNGNTTTQTATSQEAKDWKAELASPVGKVVATALTLALIGGGFIGFMLWRKKKQAESIIS